MPIMITPIIKSDVATGRRMKGSEMFIVTERSPYRSFQFLARLMAAMLRRGDGARRRPDDHFRAGLQFILAVNNDFFTDSKTVLNQGFAVLDLGYLDWPNLCGLIVLDHKHVGSVRTALDDRRRDDNAFQAGRQV